MLETKVTIATPDGACPAVIYQPDPTRPRPGVLFFPDICGLREAISAMARQLAGAGYVVMTPDVFYRQGGSTLRFPLDLTNPATQSQYAALRAPLTSAAITSDVAVCTDFLAAQPAVAAGPMGVVGCCFTGAFALRAAAAQPGRIRAAASFHGGRLCTDAPDSPHLLLPRIKARLYFAHATDDRSMPAEAIARLEQALAAWGGGGESETYAAAHGWTVPDNPAHNPVLARRAFDKLTALFASSLRG